MKKLFAIILTIGILAVAAVPSFAQGRKRRCDTNSRTYNSRTYNSSTYDSRTYDSRTYDSRTYYDSRYDNSRAYDGYNNRSRSVWNRHRDKITVGIGTGAGAAVGSMIGGKRGALIGAIAGAGGSALYTYKIRNRNRGYRY